MLLGSVPLSRFEDRSLRARRRVRSERTDRTNQIKSNSNQIKPNQTKSIKSIQTNRIKTKQNKANACSCAAQANLQSRTGPDAGDRATQLVAA